MKYQVVEVNTGSNTRSLHFGGIQYQNFKQVRLIIGLDEENLENKAKGKNWQNRCQSWTGHIDSHTKTGINNIKIKKDSYILLGKKIIQDFEEFRNNFHQIGLLI